MLRVGINVCKVPTADNPCAGGDPRTPKFSGLRAQPAYRPGLLMGRLPSLRPEFHLRLIGKAAYAVDRDKHGGVAILSISHRESRFRIRYNDVAVVDQLNAKGHDAPH